MRYSFGMRVKKTLERITMASNKFLEHDNHSLLHQVTPRVHFCVALESNWDWMEQERK